MVVDTGATSTAIAAWFAQRHALPTARVDGRATDHAGKRVAMSRTEGAVATIAGWGSLGIGPFLVYDLPPIIERLEIGMFVAPQTLGGSDRDAIVLDLKRGELRLEPKSRAFAAVEGRGRPLPPAHSCAATGPLGGPTFVLPASVGGFPARMLVDTGAQTSDLFESSDPGKMLARRSVTNDEKIYGAGGRIRSRTLRQAMVSVGEHVKSVKLDLIPGRADEHCPRDGVLAMDILRECVLVIADARLVARCDH
jgi:hypothetical protein